MSLDDRDWYRDLMRERAGLKPKWQLWKFKQRQDVDRVPVKLPRPWHPVLLILVFAVICIFTFALLKILLPK